MTDEETISTKEHGQEEQEYHFFATTAHTWRVGSDLYETLQRLEKSLGSTLRQAAEQPYIIWRIEQPPSTPYSVEVFTPQIEPKTLIERGRFKKERKKRRKT